LSGRFPQECSQENRLTIAAFEHDEPVGLVQIALHLPTSDSAALLLLVPKHLQQRHFGCEIVDRLSRQARRWPGISRWYISVVESNTAALAFWRHCGFRTTTQGLNCAGFGDRITLMDRTVKAKPACQHNGRTEDLNALNGRHMFARLG
jgi:RimJ/RimL family protein N-acetyltransferase